MAEIVDRVVEATGAERAFLFRVRKSGGFRVLIARHQDGESIPRPAVRISHYAVSRVLDSGAPFFAGDARRDRRYRTEESLRTRRQPFSILVLPLRFRQQVAGGVYLDNRFHALTFTPGVAEPAEQWRALLEIAFQKREWERLLARGLPVPRGSAQSMPPAPARALPPLPTVVAEFHDLTAASPDMLDLFDAARRLGPSDLPVLLHGETGTGKELLARAIHRSSPRAANPFMPVTCGGFPDALIESELFGHARGAYTGADSDHTGLLVQAHLGTVLLDEVGDMSQQMQQKLLSFLADGRVRPLGCKTAVQIDVRIISSTNRDLEKLVEEGRFRKDLYYRLRGTVLAVPPLRERREEILVLAERFLERFARADGRDPPLLKDSARRRLVRYDWPGNVRELENECRRLTGLQMPSVEERHLSQFIREAAGGLAPGAAQPPGFQIAQVVSIAERTAIKKALERSGGNKSRAALLLGITRKALYRRMARYGMIRAEDR
jgi:DNA-binding NtrC family response regulator